MKASVSVVSSSSFNEGFAKKASLVSVAWRRDVVDESRREMDRATEIMGDVVGGVVDWVLAEREVIVSENNDRERDRVPLENSEFAVVVEEPASREGGRIIATSLPSKVGVISGVSFSIAPSFLFRVSSCSRDVEKGPKRGVSSRKSRVRRDGMDCDACGWWDEALPRTCPFDRVVDAAARPAATSTEDGASFCASAAG